MEFEKLLSVEVFKSVQNTSTIREPYQMSTEFLKSVVHVDDM